MTAKPKVKLTEAQRGLLRLAYETWGGTILPAAIPFLHGRVLRALLDKGYIAETLFGGYYVTKPGEGVIR